MENGKGINSLQELITKKALKQLESEITKKALKQLESEYQEMLKTLRANRLLKALKMNSWSIDGYLLPASSENVLKDFDYDTKYKCNIREKLVERWQEIESDMALKIILSVEKGVDNVTR